MDLKKDKYFLALLLVILGGFLLRIYNLPQNFYYTMDEEVMNLIQRRIILGEHYPLIGSVSPLGTYLGPIFYYFGAVILAISKLNPLGQSYFATILGTATIFLIYWVGKELFNQRVGLFAAILYSFSFLQIIFDRRYWHLTLGPFLSLIVLWSLYKIKQGSIKFVYLLTAALILGWNTDYTNLVLFLFVVIAWIVFKLPFRRKEIAVAIIIFLISNIPLVLFDLRHNFLNSKAFTSYFTKREARYVSDRESLGQTRSEQAVQTAILPFITFSRTLYITSDLNISEQHTYCKPYIIERNKAQGLFLPILASIIIGLFIYLVYLHRKSKDSLGYKLVLTFYLIFQLGILFYAFIFKGDVFEHYLVTLIPYLFLMTAIILSKLYSKYSFLTLGFLLVFMVVNVNLVLKAENSLGYQNKIQATQFALEKVDNKPFSLDSISSCFRWDGFYYPFVLLSQPPVKSFQDPNYSWLFNYQIAEKQPEKVVVMVPKGRFEDDKFHETYQRYKQWVIERKSFGDLEVLILNNSKGDFH